MCSHTVHTIPQWNYGSVFSFIFKLAHKHTRFNAKYYTNCSVTLCRLLNLHGFLTTEPCFLPFLSLITSKSRQLHVQYLLRGPLLFYACLSFHCNLAELSRSPSDPLISFINLYEWTDHLSNTNFLMLTNIN